MPNISNEKFAKRLDARIAQVEENIRELNKTLKDLQSLRMDTSVTVKRLLLASEHLDILAKSRKVMQDITTTSNFRASLDRPAVTHEEMPTFHIREPEQQKIVANVVGGDG